MNYKLFMVKLSGKHTWKKSGRLRCVNKIPWLLYLVTNFFVNDCTLCWRSLKQNLSLLNSQLGLMQFLCMANWPNSPNRTNQGQVTSPKQFFYRMCQHIFFSGPWFFVFTFWAKWYDFWKRWSLSKLRKILMVSLVEASKVCRSGLEANLSTVAVKSIVEYLLRTESSTSSPVL